VWERAGRSGPARTPRRSARCEGDLPEASQRLPQKGCGRDKSEKWGERRIIGGTIA